MASVDPLVRSIANYSTQFHQNRVQTEMSVQALKKTFETGQQQALTLLASVDTSAGAPGGHAVDVYA